MAKNVGCCKVRFGFESGSESSLRYLKNQSVTIEQNYRAVELCRKVAVPCFGTFMIGVPDETLDDILQTIEFIERSRLSRFNVFVLVPYPGTEMYAVSNERGYLREGIQWRDFLVEGDILMEGKRIAPVLRNANFTSEQLLNIHRYIYSNLVFPLMVGTTAPKRNHAKELKNILAGNLRRTRPPRADVARYYVGKVTRTPSRIGPFLKRRFEWLKYEFQERGARS